MKMHALAAAACLAALPALAADNPFAAMKGKIKEGMWQYTMEMGAVPGMPAGMKMPPMTFNRCLTAKEIEEGGATTKDGKMPEQCKVKNMKVSGNTASYTMECTRDPKVKSDVVMTFPVYTNDGKWNTLWPVRPSFVVFLRSVLRFQGNAK